MKGLLPFKRPTTVQKRALLVGVIAWLLIVVSIGGSALAKGSGNWLDRNWKYGMLSGFVVFAICWVVIFLESMSDKSGK